MYQLIANEAKQSKASVTITTSTTLRIRLFPDPLYAASVSSCKVKITRAPATTGRIDYLVIQKLFSLSLAPGSSE